MRDAALYLGLLVSVFMACAGDSFDCSCHRCDECRDEGDTVWVVVRDTITLNARLPARAARAAARRTLDALSRRQLLWCAEAMRLADGRCVADACDSSAGAALRRLIENAAVDIIQTPGENAMHASARLARNDILHCLREKAAR